MSKKTPNELREEIKRLQAELVEQRAEEIQLGVAELNKVIDNFELSYSDVYKAIKKRFPDLKADVSSQPATSEVKNKPPKFKHPDTQETWSGVGNPIKWVQAIINQNKATDPNYRFTKDLKYRNPEYPWKR